LSSTQIDTSLSFVLPISAENSQSNPLQGVQVKKIYVGNFSFNMTEPDLRALFEPYGSVESVTLVTDRETGRSRGFGFVAMTNDEEAEKAMAALNGANSGGRALTVNEAKPQTPRSGFGGGGGGRGGDRDRDRSRNRQSRW
jgi:RNA recognition motif-containing protein